MKEEVGVAISSGVDQPWESLNSSTPLSTRAFLTCLRSELLHGESSTSKIQVPPTWARTLPNRGANGQAFNSDCQANFMLVSISSFLS